jgi:DNA-binding NtrC family response regulator
MEMPLKTHKVLIVDDQVRILDLFKRILDGEEYEVVTRCGSEKGLEFIQTIKFPWLFQVIANKKV